MPDSESVESLGTGVDDILEELSNRGKASVSTLASETGYDENKIKSWGKALENSGLVQVKYSGIKGMVLIYELDKDSDKISKEEVKDGSSEESAVEKSDENNSEDKSGESREKEDSDNSAVDSVAKTVHREEKENLDDGADDLDRKSLKDSLGKDIVEESKINDSNIVEINESEINELSLEGSQEGIEEVDEVEKPKKNSLEEKLEEDLEELESLEKIIREEENKNKEADSEEDLDGSEGKEVKIEDEEKDFQEEDVEEVVLDQENLPQDEKIIQSEINQSKDKGDDRIVKDVKATLEEIRNLNKKFRNTDVNQETFDKLEEELNSLKNLVEGEDLPRELDKEVIRCMNEAGDNLEDKAEGGIFYRLKSIFGLGYGNSTKSNLDNQDNSVKNLGNNERIKSFEDRRRNTKNEPLLDNEDFENISHKIKDKSGGSADYEPGESINEILDSIEDLKDDIVSGKENISYRELEEEMARMREILNNKDLDKHEQKEVIETINSLEDAMNIGSSTLVERIKSSIRGVVQ